MYSKLVRSRYAVLPCFVFLQFVVSVDSVMPTPYFNAC